jgi:hypothetical protein
MKCIRPEGSGPASLPRKMEEVQEEKKKEE